MTGLEAYLLEIARYGKPRLGMYSKGWHCNVEMHVEAKGCSFDISSDFGRDSPIDAATQCLERVRVALEGFGELKDMERLK